jgi:hypothetical protein
VADKWEAENGVPELVVKLPKGESTFLLEFLVSLPCALGLIFKKGLTFCRLRRQQTFLFEGYLNARKERNLP